MSGVQIESGVNISMEARLPPITREWVSSWFRLAARGEDEELGRQIARHKVMTMSRIIVLDLVILVGIYLCN